MKSSGISGETEAVLRYYDSLGLLEVLEWDVDMPFCRQSSEYCALHQIQVSPPFLAALLPLCGRLDSVEECVMRTAYRYNYTLISDFDELLRGFNLSQSLPDLIASLDDSDIGSFTFKVTRQCITSLHRTFAQSLPVRSVGDVSLKACRPNTT